jgi:hypothetical protein
MNSKKESIHGELPTECKATPHETLITNLMNPNFAKDEYHHAAAREIESLSAKNKELRGDIETLEFDLSNAISALQSTLARQSTNRKQL